MSKFFEAKEQHGHAANGSQTNAQTTYYYDALGHLLASLQSVPTGAAIHGAGQLPQGAQETIVTTYHYDGEGHQIAGPQGAPGSASP